MMSITWSVFLESRQVDDSRYFDRLRRTHVTDRSRQALFSDTRLIHQQGQSALQGSAQQMLTHHLSDGIDTKTIGMFGNQLDQLVKLGFWGDSRHVVSFMAQLSCYCVIKSVRHELSRQIK